MGTSSAPSGSPRNEAVRGITARGGTGRRPAISTKVTVGRTGVLGSRSAVGRGVVKFTCRRGHRCKSTRLQGRY